MPRIEEMSPADLPEVVAIEELSFSNPWTRGMFMVEMTLPQSRTVVIKTEEQGSVSRIAGYACWWNVAGEVHILDIAVHPDFRHMGHATELAKTILDEARESNAEKIFLEVRASNLPARNFYGKLGFRETGLRPRYYDKPSEDAVCMTLEPINGGDPLR
ncbi:MAG: ribosomal protein S18-alanine N-acetyltransferase [Nitrospirota bacterium]|nr:ribosomal protein S18-alanine N-acetyltransferase [Nitrospirota bacterium]